MNPDLIFFFLLATVSVVSALAMLLARNPVYSAIFLILNFSTIAIFYLLLSAPFIAMAQITVYAGAIMVLFLFVVMLLGGEQAPRSSVLPWQKPLALGLGVLLLIEIAYLFITRAEVTALTGEALTGFGSPSQIGWILFTDFLLPFEIAGILLLVAMIGAIVLTQKERYLRRQQVWGEAANPTGTAGNGRDEQAAAEEMAGDSSAHEAQLKR
jgi:NADH-quinone oxidoreductase subunit J